MRVHVISDMEGVAGIVKWQQVGGGEAMYEEGRRLYTGEINAAVRGAKAAGATEIVVMDCHGAGEGWTFNSLIPDELDPDCEYVVQDEWTEYTEFLEEGCDAALFVGMHARAGTSKGVMNHTISGRDYQNLWFNGTLVGETGINAALCGNWGCPVLLVTGDEATCARSARPPGRGNHHGLGQAWPRRRLRPHASAAQGSRADRGGCESGTDRPASGATVRPGKPVRGEGRVQEHGRSGQAPRPTGRRAARRSDGRIPCGHMVGRLAAVFLLAAGV